MLFVGELSQLPLMARGFRSQSCVDVSLNCYAGPQSRNLGLRGA
jgi:hypothetical protein